MDTYWKRVRRKNEKHWSTKNIYKKNIHMEHTKHWRIEPDEKWFSIVIVCENITQQLLWQWLFVLPYATVHMNEWSNTIQFLFACCAMIVRLHWRYVYVYKCVCIKLNRYFLRRANHSGIYKFSLLPKCLSPSGILFCLFFFFHFLPLFLIRLMYCRNNTHKNIYANKAHTMTFGCIPKITKNFRSYSHVFFSFFLLSFQVEHFA